MDKPAETLNSLKKPLLKNKAVLVLLLAIFLVLLVNVGLFVLMKKARQQMPGVYVTDSADFTSLHRAANSSTGDYITYTNTTSKPAFNVLIADLGYIPEISNEGTELLYRTQIPGTTDFITYTPSHGGTTAV